MLALDTDILIEIERKNLKVIKFITDLRKEHPEEIAITSAVYAEFYFGLMSLKDAKREKASKSVEFYRILDFDKQSVRRFSQLKWVLEKDGRTIPVFDLVTASIALSHGATVVTNDAHYERVPGLNVEMVSHE